MNTTHTAAYAHFVNGMSIMPVKKDKKPYLASWKKYQTQHPTESEILEWWECYPEANIGIITGKISGISVIDIDDPVATPLSTFPETYTVQTGNGGYHLYYQYQEGLSISARAYPQFPGVDIRSDGGFVVAPPSITEYEKDGIKKGGAYTVINSQLFAPFPIHLFKAKKKLTNMVSVGSGSRNQSIASVIGTLLHSMPEKQWSTDVYATVVQINKTYQPPLDDKELRTTFDSIVKKETERRQALIVSPIQIDDEGGTIAVSVRKNGNGVAYKDMANVLAILEQHPLYRETIKYNQFRQEIEYLGKPIEDSDLFKIQYFMQTQGGLQGISKDAVYSALTHYAYQHAYDEAQEWVKGLSWDGIPRLTTWLSTATGIEDTPYHQAVGAQWFLGLIKRIMYPGCIFDYVLVIVGAQGIGKTSLFRIIGGPWYKSYTGAIDNKDFYLALRGAVIVDLDEGAALYRSEAIKIKSIITETHDEYRAPYDRLMKKYPRRFVFSMSTNDTEPFQDVTGNRRYWTIDGAQTINFKWLEENREQLYAEAYHCLQHDVVLPTVSFTEAHQKQEHHLAEDSWTDLIMTEIKKSLDYCEGNTEYYATVIDIYRNIFGADHLDRLNKGQQMRITNIFKKTAGLVKRQEMIDGERKVKWYLSPEKAKELQEHIKTKTKSIDDF